MALLVTVLLVLPSLAVSAAAVAAVKRNAERLGLLDKPNHRKVHSVPIPLGGGLGVWLALLLVAAAGTAGIYGFGEAALEALGLGRLAEHLPGMRERLGLLWQLIACATVLTFLGLADDRRHIAWYWRIAVEFAVAAYVVFALKIRLTAFIPVELLGSLASVFWIVLLINSFNMLDNMDGLSGGVAAIVCIALIGMLLGGLGGDGQPQLFVAWMLAALLGGLLGFLCHNWPPASIFMGDAGSYLVGFWIAVATLLTTYTGYRSSTPHAVLAPLCVLAIPLYDTISVIWIRVRSGRSPFEADKRHFSHRLVELGLSKRAAVFTIYAATLTTALGALLLPRTDWIGACIVLGIVACVCCLIAMLESLALRRVEDRPGPGA